jgi:hypothetical protein
MAIATFIQEGKQYESPGRSSAAWQKLCLDKPVLSLAEFLALQPTDVKSPDPIRIANHTWLSPSLTKFGSGCEATTPLRLTSSQMNTASARSSKTRPDSSNNEPGMSKTRPRTYPDTMVNDGSI